MSELTHFLSRPHLSANQLKEVHVTFSARADFVEELIRLIPLLDASHVWRPIALLRMTAETRGLREEDVAKILQHVDVMEHWLARLLCCQLLAVTGCPRECEDDAFPFLEDCFRDRRVIIRAWALTVLTRFKGRHHQKSIASMLATAQKDPAKSMQARLRHLSIPPQTRALRTHE